MDDVQRLFNTLVDVLADNDPDKLFTPMQASEVYQTIVPYRRFRSALRFDSNQDYEMAVLRLLAGERGYVSVEPPQAQEELRDEAEAINPDPSVIRDYAAIRVYLNANAVRGILSAREAYAPPEEGEPTEPEEDTADPARFEPGIVDPPDLYAEDSEDDERDVAGVAAGDPEDAEDPGETGATAIAESGDNGGTEPPGENWDDEGAGDEPEIPTAEQQPNEVAQIDSHGTDETVATPDEEAVGRCIACNRELPSDREVLFCPFCGKSQAVRECRACGTVLDIEWTFCIKCGEPI
ncbi:MAG: zinc ribbon domain-containing protein [Gemmatimonadales bacterium]